MSKHPNNKKRNIGSCGMAKHRVSFGSTYSPKLKYYMKLEAEKNEKANPQKCFSTVAELFNIEHSKNV